MTTTPPTDPKQPKRPKRGSGEGYISQRKDRDGRPLKGQWRGELMVGYLPDGRPDVRRVSGTTRAEVQDKLHDLREKVTGGALPPREKRTLAQHATIWLRDDAKPRLRDVSYTVMAGCLRRYILPALGHLPLTTLTAEHARRLYADLGARGLAPRTIRITAVALGQLLNDAATLRLIPRNPTKGLRLPKPPQRLPRALTAEQVDQLRAAAANTEPRRRDNPYLHALMVAFIDLALATGARVGELLALETTRINRDERQVRIERTYHYAHDSYSDPKSARSRRQITVPHSTIETLATWRRVLATQHLRLGPDWDARPQDGDLLFPAPTGRPLRYSTLHERFDRLAAAAGLPETTIHDLRHTHATHLLLAGQPPHVVAARLGHSTATLLATYAHVLPDSDQAAANAIGRVLYGT